MTLQFNDSIDYTQPSKLRNNTFILYENLVYQINNCSGPIKGGKHGSAKYIFSVVELSNNKKKNSFI